MVNTRKPFIYTQEHKLHGATRSPPSERGQITIRAGTRVSRVSTVLGNCSHGGVPKKACA
jgi:hypothetical protein